MKNVFKRLVSGVLCLIFISCSLSVYAVESTSATATAKSLIQFYRTNNKLDKTSISNKDLQIFGVFVSNFFVPLETNINKLDNFEKNIVDLFFGGDNSNMEDVKWIMDLVKKVIVQQRKPLKLRDKSGNTKGAGVTLKAVFDETDGFDLVYDVGDGLGQKVVYHQGKADPASKSTSSMALFATLGLSNPDKVKDYVNSANKALYIDGFGNITDETGLVIMPGCINPYTFTPDGSKFPVNNSFFMPAIKPALVRKNGSIVSYKATSPLGAIHESEDNLGIYMYELFEPHGFKDGVAKGDLSGVDPIKSISAFLGGSRKSSNTRVAIRLSPDLVKVGSWRGFIANFFGVNDTASSKTLYNISTDSLVLDGTDNLLDSVYLFDTVSWKSDNAPKKYSLFNTQGLSPMADAFNVAKTKGLLGSKTPSPPNLEAVPASDKNALKTVIDKFNEMTELEITMDKYNEGLRLYYLLKYGVNNPKSANIAKFSDYDNSSFTYLLSGKGGQSSTLFSPTVADGRLKDIDSIMYNDLWGSSVTYSDSSFFANPFVDFSDFSATQKSNLNKLYNDKDSAYSPFYGSAWASKLVYKTYSLDPALQNSLVSSAQIVNGIRVANNVNLWGGIYYAYTVQLDPSTYSSNLPPIDVGLAKQSSAWDEVLGQAGNSVSDKAELERMQKDIIRYTYSLLSPESNAYSMKLMSTRVNDFVLDSHNKIVGATVSDNVTAVGSSGGRPYSGFSGFVTTPQLSDLPWTAVVLDKYYLIYIVLLLLVIIVMGVFALVGLKTIQQSLVGTVIFAFVLLLPPFVLNTGISLSNEASNRIYSGRFNFWAITQYQQYVGAGDSRVSENDKLLIDNLQMAKDTYSKDSGISLKWMSPKKRSVFDSMFKNSYNNPNVSVSSNLFKWMFNGFFQQETYTNDDMATYLYRSYIDIVKSADTVYKSRWNNYSKTYVSGSIYDLWQRSDYLKNRGIQQDYGSYLNVKKSQFPGLTNNYIRNLRWLPVLSSNNVNKAITEKVSSVVPGVTSFGLTSTNNVNSNGGALDDETFEKEMFLLYTESPFYYFYFTLLDSGAVKLSSSDNQSKGYVSLILDKDFFTVNTPNKNYSGYTKDYLDLEGLFTEVVPYLNASNQVVNDWRNTYGLDVYKNSVGMADTKPEDVSKDPSLQAKFALEQWHNNQVANVWAMYSPWVDLMYSTKYARNQHARKLDSKVMINDALNPQNYADNGRTMVFSSADMRAHGYSELDLTTVEKKMQTVLNDTKEDMYYLMNYVAFDERVLTATAAMMATFNFNRQFSETHWLSESITLYPQSYELKNFSYDAFLRLILLNSTGEPLMSEKGLYERVLSNTSLFTGLVLLVNDALAVYVVSGLKVFFLLAVLILCVLVLMCSSVNPDTKLSKVVFGTLFKPTIIFLIASILHAFLISLFMGEGLIDIMGAKNVSIVTNDPTLTLIALIIINSLYSFVLFKLSIVVIKNIKVYGTDLFANTAIAFSKFGSLAMGTVTGALGGIAGSIGFNMMRRRNVHDMQTAFEGALGSGGGGSDSPSVGGDSPLSPLGLNNGEGEARDEVATTSHSDIDSIVEHQRGRYNNELASLNNDTAQPVNFNQPKGDLREVRDKILADSSVPVEHKLKEIKERCGESLYNETRKLDFIEKNIEEAKKEDFIRKFCGDTALSHYTKKKNDEKLDLELNEAISSKLPEDKQNEFRNLFFDVSKDDASKTSRPVEDLKIDLPSSTNNDQKSDS